MNFNFDIRVFIFCIILVKRVFSINRGIYLEVLYYEFFEVFLLFFNIVYLEW